MLVMSKEKGSIKDKLVNAYMDTAFRFADCSTAEKMKVGALLVKDDRIISIGYNGTPPGWDNVCENVIEDENGETSLKTKDEVYHAESNAILKLAKCNEDGKEASMFCTHAPCINCAKLIAQSGIKELYYKDVYREETGLEFLKMNGINIIRV